MTNKCERCGGDLCDLCNENLCCPCREAEEELDDIAIVETSGRSWEAFSELIDRVDRAVSAEMMLPRELL